MTDISAIGPKELKQTLLAARPDALCSVPYSGTQVLGTQISDLSVDCT